MGRGRFLAFGNLAAEVAAIDNGAAPTGQQNTLFSAQVRTAGSRSSADSSKGTSALAPMSFSCEPGYATDGSNVVCEVRLRQAASNNAAPISLTSDCGWGKSVRRIPLGVPPLGTEVSFVAAGLYNDKAILGCRYGTSRPRV